MPTTSVPQEQVPEKTADIVQNALADALREQGLIVPPNELQNINNFVEDQAQALAQGLLDQAAAEEYLAGDEFGQNEETTRRKTLTSKEQEATPTGEEGSEVEQEATRERNLEGTEPAEKPGAPTAGAQPEATTPTPTPQPTLPTGIHAEAQPQEEPHGEVAEGQEEVVPPEIAEARSREQENEVPSDRMDAGLEKSSQERRERKAQPQPKEERQTQPQKPPETQQEKQPEQESAPGAPSGDITPPEETPGESKEKQETPKQKGGPKSEQEQAADTKKAQQQARLEQGAAQTGEISEAEKELKTLKDKVRQFGPSLGKMLLPVADAVQEFLPLLDTGFIAGLVSIVTTASKVLWFMSQGAHLKEFVWKKAKARFAISSIIEVVPWLNWIPSALLTDIFTLKNIRDKRTEFTTQINALTAKIKKLTTRR